MSEVFPLIQTRVIGKDVQSILNLDLEFLKINLPAEGCFGTITLCGFSHQEDTFKVYALHVNSHAGEQDWIETNIMVLPIFTKAIKQIGNCEDPLDELAGKAIDVIKQCDESAPVKERVGISGQVFVNILQVDKCRNIKYNCFTYHTYPDFDELGNKMMEHI